jgi:hypothetical protein
MNSNLELGGTDPSNCVSPSNAEPNSENVLVSAALCKGNRISDIHFRSIFHPFAA